MKKKLTNFIKNISKIFKKENINKNMGLLVVGGLLLIFVVFTLIYFIGTKKVSAIEEKELKEKSKNLINYIENITKIKSDINDKYIIYALEYSYGVNSKNELTCEEIENFIKDNFNKKIDAEEIRNIGVSPNMLEKNITYNSVKDSYKLNIINVDGLTISSTPITYYKLEKIRKYNKKKFVMTYREYTIENPNEMLNYYLEKNMNVEGKQNENGEYTYDLFDITPIRNYLIGNGKLGDLKNVINDDDISKFAKKGKKLKIIYTVKDDKLLINKIK